MGRLDSLDIHGPLSYEQALALHTAAEELSDVLMRAVANDSSSSLYRAMEQVNAAFVCLGRVCSECEDEDSAADERDLEWQTAAVAR